MKGVPRRKVRLSRGEIQLLEKEIPTEEKGSHREETRWEE